MGIEIGDLAYVCVYVRAWAIGIEIVNKWGYEWECAYVTFNWTVFLKDHHQCVSADIWIVLKWNDGWPKNQSTLYSRHSFRSTFRVEWHSSMLSLSLSECMRALLCGYIWSIDRQKQMILIEKYSFSQLLAWHTFSFHIKAVEEQKKKKAKRHTRLKFNYINWTIRER